MPRDIQMADSPSASGDSAWTGGAFLVQLSPDADPAAGVFHGRIQHLRSCDAAHFTSIDDLVTFIRIRTALDASYPSSAK